MADHKQEETFKVIDRRLFNEEGELRKDAAEQARREEEASAKKPAGRGQQRGDVKSAAPAQPEFPSVGELPDLFQGEHGDETPAGAIQPLPNFQMLVEFLGRNAAAMLGGMNDPRTGQPLMDLDGAREVIDMLDALRETTRGNLSKIDNDLLVEVIGSLKLSFMEISKAASEAKAKKAGARK